MRKILRFLFGWIIDLLTSKPKPVNQKPKERKAKIDRTEGGKYEFIGGFRWPTRRYVAELRERRLIERQGCKIFYINGHRILARNKKNADRKFYNILANE